MGGWHLLRWITSQGETTKLGPICSLGNLFNFSLTLLVGGNQRLSPSSLTWPKKGGNGLLNNLPSRNQFHTSGIMKLPFRPPPSGISTGTKLRHKNRHLSSGQSSIRRLWFMNGGAKFWWGLIKVSLIAAFSRWNIGSTVLHSLSTVCDTQLISFGNFLPKK